MATCLPSPHRLVEVNKLRLHELFGFYPVLVTFHFIFEGLRVCPWNCFLHLSLHSCVYLAIKVPSLEQEKVDIFPIRYSEIRSPLSLSAMLHHIFKMWDFVTLHILVHYLELYSVDRQLFQSLNRIHFSLLSVGSFLCFPQVSWLGRKSNRGNPPKHSITEEEHR